MKQKISVATSSFYSFPLIRHLSIKKVLDKVIISEEANVLNAELENFLDKSSILVTSTPNDIKLDSDSALLTFGYPYKINLSLINKANAMNLHFGPLPENRGPDPVFWTINEAKRLAYVSIHLLSESYDSGDLIMQKSIPTIPGETYGLLSNRLSHLAASLFNDQSFLNSKTTPQNESDAHYFKKPTKENLTINWEQMTSGQIESLVNACNPKYGGASCFLNETPVKIIEVSPTDQNGKLTKGEKNGKIIHSNPSEGLYVKCKNDEILRVNIVSINEGIISGNKLASLLVSKEGQFH